jgi:four helix bundle protein
MFDFEKLNVYQKAKAFNLSVISFVDQESLNRNLSNQLTRASLSILLNIAEGSGRFTDKDKRNFYVIARGSAFECAAIFDFLKDKNQIEIEKFKSFYLHLEEISKMLFAMIKKLT